MTRPTHILIAASGGLAAGELAHASPAGRCVVLVAALAANELPDKDRHAQRGVKRGPTHWLVVGFLVAAVAGLIVSATAPMVGTLAFAGFLTGYWLHLLADALTPEGCPLFGPFPGVVRLLPFRIRIVAGRPKRGWTGCPYVPVPEPIAVVAIGLADVVFLLPHLAT